MPDGAGARRRPTWAAEVGVEGHPGTLVDALERVVLPRILMEARWYGAKDAGPPSVRLADLIGFGPDGDVAVALLAVTPPGRPPQTWVMPLSVDWRDDAPAGAIARITDGRRQGHLVDAVANGAFARAFVGAVAQGATEGLTLRRTHAPFDAAAFAAAPVTTTGAEQSNSSIRFGDVAILKLFRRIEPGIHPEVEVGRFLTGTAGFDGAPALLGWLELGGTEPIVVASLMQLVPGARDGWETVTDMMRNDAGEAALVALARTLGRRTAAMHRAFATPTDDPAFRAEPTTAADLDTLAAAAEHDARRVLDRLAGRSDPDSSRLVARRDDLLRALGAVRAPRTPKARTRIHGDYHLGQVLVADGEVWIIDFEGEPLRPLADRRAKQIPLKDVAGMLRSFAYAAATAGRADDAGMAAAFLDAYRDMVAEPLDAGLLRFFLLEKAVYEVAYELANRPDWVGIPVRGILGLLDAAVGRSRMHDMPFGAAILPDGRTRFALWAPGHATVRLSLEGRGEPLAMTRDEDGWHRLVHAEAPAGTRYRYILPDGLAVPDPATRHQPEGVHGPSAVIDPRAFHWTDGGWRGRPWREAVILEVHVGTFTPDGTFRAVIDRLDHLVETGITAVQLMPVADFPGDRNWGYDGVDLFAPAGAYGRPEDLKVLIDACHAHGLMVFLDVVYNHFGPDGNYLAVIAPLFTERHHTPWGAAIDYDGPQSRWNREFVLHNVLYWLEEFRFDGLRLDAVHAIVDDSPEHLLDAIARTVRERYDGRREIHLILENEENAASRLARGPDGRLRGFTAQWNDDVHYVLHTAATGEKAGYYADYAGDTGKLARALAEGFAFQGETMPYRGSVRGEPSAHLCPLAFVAFAQNHDQIGNRAFGDRLTTLGPPEAVRAVGAIVLLLPQVPMLFMGEEWGAMEPFPFFCDFGPDLADAVRDGRREEFARFPEFRSPERRALIPDPVARSTFLSAKLDWPAIGRAPHADRLAWTRSLLAVRAREIVPALPHLPGGSAGANEHGPGVVSVRWRLDDGRRLCLVANLSATPADVAPRPAGRVLWQENPTAGPGLGPWEVGWSIEDEAREGSDE